MSPGLQRTRFTDPALIRLLAQLAKLDVRGSDQVFAERLSRWLHWTDAGDLSVALNDGTVASQAPAPVSPAAGAAEVTRLREAMVAAIKDDCSPPDEPRHPKLTESSAAVSRDAQADFSTYRLRYLTRQQAMEASIQPLRGRLRAALSSSSADMARLAALDAVMERVLSAHERALLSGVPGLLMKHFEDLRGSHQASGEGSQPEDWMLVFRNNMQGVLLAELDMRLQPVEGLLAALHRTSSEAHPPP